MIRKLNSTNILKISIFVILVVCFILAFTITNLSAATTTPESTSTTKVGAGEDKTKKSQDELIGDIIFSTPSSAFSKQISVTLSSKTANAEIRYTTDGSKPTSSSTVYKSALTFTATTQLRAQAFVNGTASGKMGTAIYIASAVNSKHDVPILLLDAYGGGKPAKDYKNVACMIMEPKNGEATLLQAPNLATRAGFHVRGQSSSSFAKTPYRLELWDNENKDADYSVCGMPADSDWAMLSPYPDKSLIRNSFAYSVGSDLGLVAPRSKAVEVYLNLDKNPVSADDYQGVYYLQETIKANSDRLNIAKLKAEDTAEPNLTGGYLLQFNMGCAEAPLIKGTGWNDLELEEPKNPTSQQTSYITSYIQKVQNSMSSSNEQTGYPAYIDVDSFVNFIILNEMAREGDSYMRSTRIYKDRGKKITAGPLWDYDLAFECFTGFGGMMGGFGGGAGGATTMSTVQGWQFQPMAMGGFGGGTTCDWYNKLMHDANFQTKINNRWKTLRQGALSDNNLRTKISKLSSPMSNAAKRNFQKWPILNTKTVGNFGTQTSQTWEEQITILQNYILQRCAWLDKSGWKPTQ